jgi:hypothetical protein
MVDSYLVGSTVLQVRLILFPAHWLCTAANSMPDPTDTTLLDDLDTRQDAVLLQLTELNDRVERLLQQHTIGLRVVEPGQEDSPAAA